MTTSNDATQVFIPTLPERKVNPHLEERARHGAQVHALSEKEHPNLTAWKYAASALPFAVATGPAAIVTGDGLAATAVGQAVGSGLSSVASAAKAAPLVQKALPWANAAFTSYMGANGLNDVSQGKFTPETILDLAPLWQFARAGKGVRSVANKASSTPTTNRTTFKSELDWSPESWFSTRQGYGYDAEDIATLKRHVPEYLDIERKTKANGTWLKMPDGTTWTGDPRSWVQLMSRDGLKLAMERNFGAVSYLSYAGDPVQRSKDYVTYTGRSWLQNNEDMAKMWSGHDHLLTRKRGAKYFEITYPKDSLIMTVEANGAKHSAIPHPDLRAHGRLTFTDKIADYSDDKGFDALRINNVVEGLGHKVNDLVLSEDLPRKSLLGNNGNFDFLKKNIYKGFMPLIFDSGLYGIKD